MKQSSNTQRARLLPATAFMDRSANTAQHEDVWYRPRGEDGSKPATTPAERKQRRLESNRAAAKRAYYRRQDKVQNLQLQNEQMRKAAVEHRFKISIYESLLRRLGVDPDVAVEAIRGSAKPVLVPAPKPKTAADKPLPQPPQDNCPSASDQLRAIQQPQDPKLQPLTVVQPATAGPVQGLPAVGLNDFGGAT